MKIDRVLGIAVAAVGTKGHARACFERGLALSLVAAFGFAVPASAASCPNEDVRAFQHTTYLNDCRGIELVNRADKGPQHVRVEPLASNDGRAWSPEGDKILWTVASGAPGGSAGTWNTFLASRGPAGWESRTPIPPASEQVGGGSRKYVPQAGSTDFSSFIFRTEEAGFAGGLPRATFVRLDEHQNQDVLATIESNGNASAVDLTGDALHVLHIDNDLTPPQLVDIGSGADEVVSIMPNESLPPCGVENVRGFVTGTNLAHSYPSYHWISVTDASRIYFQTSGDGDCTKTELGLYVRNRDAGSTTEIASEADFIRASADGRSGYFTTKLALAASDLNAHQDVYRWTEANGSECLTCVVGDANLLLGPLVGEHAARVLISDDESHIYFTSQEELIPGHGEVGLFNLYSLSHGTLKYVASASEEPLTDSDARMSANGSILVVRSKAHLTSDEVVGETAEIYRYDDAGGGIECLSCVKGGMTTLPAVQAASSQGGLGTSADGSTVVFTTAERLLDGDVNGGFDIYEWRLGQVGLVTDGLREYSGGRASPSVVGVDADGSDIFFTVADPGRTGFEADGLDNLYDARIDGGFLPPSAPVHCAEDACQGPLLAAPPGIEPVSMAYVQKIRAHRPRKRHCGSKARGRPQGAGKRCHRKGRAKHGSRAGRSDKVETRGTN